MLNKTQKSELIKDLADRLRRNKIAIFSDFRGISVAKMQALRRLLRKSEAEYKVSKKTLLDRALEAVGLRARTKELEGEIGVAFGYGDETAAAKTLLKFSKENETFKILGGILGERVLKDKEVIAIAKLPKREILLGQLVGVLQSPIRGLATVLGGNLRNLVVVLNGIKEAKS